MDQTEDDPTILTIENADGTRYALRLLDVFDFEGQEYGLFTPVEILTLDDNNSPAGDITVMQIVRKGGEAVLRVIADNKEYERVVAHVEEMARKSGG